ncbi:MAG: DUF928 domain-containing protein [Leptolyngbya sp. SIO4C1]|nr:DUF928 domain-containing protein [Leptolyngbya sp. SIO4C1]
MLPVLPVLPGVAQTEGSDSLRQGLPGRRISGGSRVPTEACVLDQQPLIALVPDDAIGLTGKAAPTLWFALPAVSPSRSLEFGLFTQDDQLIYQTTLPVSAAGVRSIDLTQLEGAPALTVDENYRWYLSIVCNPSNRSEDIWVDGWVRRVDLPSAMAADLASASPLDQPHLYLQAGLWHEAITELATLVQRYPESAALEQQWQALLSSIDLDQAVDAPVLSPSTRLRSRKLAVSP